MFRVFEVRYFGVRSKTNRYLGMMISLEFESTKFLILLQSVVVGYLCVSQVPPKLVLFWPFLLVGDN